MSCALCRKVISRRPNMSTAELTGLVKPYALPFPFPFPAPLHSTTISAHISLIHNSSPAGLTVPDPPDSA